MRYVGSRPITDINTNKYSLSSEYMVSCVIFRMVALSDWARNLFCWVDWLWMVVVSVGCSRSYGIKWMWLSDGDTRSNIDAWIVIDFSRVSLSGWNLITWATVVTQALPFPKPTRFVDRSKADNTMVLFYVSGFFYCYRCCVCCWRWFCWWRRCIFGVRLCRSRSGHRSLGR